MINYSVRFLKDVPGHLDWLHPSELSIFQHFKVEKRKNDWLLGRWTAKNLLQKRFYPDKNLNELAVLPGEKRAPFAYLNGEKQQCTISISHSHGKSFCVTADGSFKIGCDLEKIESRSINFIKDYFTEKERELGKTLSATIDAPSFYTVCWSAKESLMKALRIGLTLHPRKIQVETIEIRNREWSHIKVRNLQTNEVFHGLWRSKNNLVYLVLYDDFNEILINNFSMI